MAERIVVSLTSADQEYQALQGEDAREAGRRLGVDVEVLFAEDNAVLQIQQLFRFVHAPEGERPAALLVHTRVRRRPRAGRPQRRPGRRRLVPAQPHRTLRRRPAERVPDDSRSRRSPPTTLEIGRIHARQLERLCPDGSPRPLRAGARGDARGPAASRGLRGGACAGGSYDLKVVNGEWTAASAEKAITAWLRLQDLGPLPARGRRLPERQHGARGAQKPSSGLRPEWGRVPFLGCDGLPKRRAARRGRGPPGRDRHDAVLRQPRDRARGEVDPDRRACRRPGPSSRPPPTPRA